MFMWMLDEKQVFSRVCTLLKKERELSNRSLIERENTQQQQKIRRAHT